MNIKKYIPNAFTFGNLLCGLIALLFAISWRFEEAAFFVMLGIFLDFFDGFFARIWNVQGELGKQLDSLADMVTSGVVPGVIMFLLISESFSFTTQESIKGKELLELISLDFGYWHYLGLLLSLAAAYRLAKFNIDTRQSESFIGLPTPAMSLFIISLPLIQMNTDIQFVKDVISNPYFLIGIVLLLSYLMNANLYLLALKFKNYGLKENAYKYLLILASIALLITIQYVAVPIIILLYIALSLVKNITTKSAVS